jgi:alkylmercury lyase
MNEGPGYLRILGTEKTDEERVLCRAALHGILAGEPLDRSGLVEATGLAQEKVDALLDGLIRRGLAVLDPESGRVVGSWGLSLIPTDHRLSILGRELYTWCALDAVGIPAGLGEDASIASRCQQCGRPVKVRMAAGQLSHVEPADAPIWVAAGQAGRSVVGFT